jgi:membrane fusion protein, type I secretion system
MTAKSSFVTRIGITAIAGASLVGGAGGWLLTQRTTRDVVASGAVIVDVDSKAVRSGASGTIAEVRVRDGDPVAAGDVVMRLDDAVARGSLEAIDHMLDELAARQARLKAELEDAPTPRFPSELTKRAGEPEVAQALASEYNLFKIRSLARAAEKEQLNQRISELKNEIGGYSVLMAAKDSELSLIDQQLKGMRDLRAKNLMPLAALTTLERDAVRIDGERRGQLVATVAQAEGRIAKMRLLVMQVDRERIGDVGRELRDTEARTAEVLERKLTIQDRMRRLEIRAPQSGIAHVATLRSAGEDVSAGDEVMAIAPRSDNLIVEATIASRDIPRLRVGQSAVLQFTAGGRGQEKITGTLSRLAPEAATDRSGVYRARIAVAAPECARLGTVRPGTQAEVLLEAEQDASLAGIWRPIGDGLVRALRSI